MRPLTLLVNVALFKLAFFYLSASIFSIFVFVKVLQKSNGLKRKQKLNSVLYKEIHKNKEICCLAGKKLMALIETLVSQPSSVYHVLDATESEDARSIREEGDRTSRTKYCLQCIEDTIKNNDNYTPTTFVHLETTEDLLLWIHQVLYYLESFAPALKIAANGINAIFEEEFSEESFERIRKVSAAYGMLYKYLDELAICCETAKGVAVDREVMMILSELLKGSGSHLAEMPQNAKRLLENNPQNDYVSISIPWQIDELLLAKIKVKIEDLQKRLDENKHL